MKVITAAVMALAVVVTAGIPPAAAQSAASCLPLPQLTVRGEAVLRVPADQMQLEIGVVTTAETADEALRLNTRRMQRVETALTGSGLAADEYQTGHFQVRPRWVPRPREAGPDWQPRIAGYTVSNRFRVRTRQLEHAGRLIESVTRAGANQIDALAFTLADPRRHREAAIASATAHAAADARSLAAAAGVRLGGVLSLTLDHAAAGPHRPVRSVLMEAGKTGDRAAPDIVPGDVEVRAGVTAVYRLSGE